MAHLRLVQMSQPKARRRRNYRRNKERRKWERGFRENGYWFSKGINCRPNHIEYTLPLRNPAEWIVPHGRMLTPQEVWEKYGHEENSLTAADEK